MCLGTLIDIELKRDEFTAAIKPPFQKGNYEFETGQGAADLPDPERSRPVTQGETTDRLRMGDDNRIPFERKGSLLRFRLDAVMAWNEPTR